MTTVWKRVLALVLSVLMLATCGWTAVFAEDDEDEEENENLPEKPVSNPEADLEDENDWNLMFSFLPRTGNWADDLVLVAESQLGYTESKENFEAVLNEDKDGYDLFGWTRYGAWYGYPYGDWCATFISFCLSYAGIPAEAFPYDSGTVNWVAALINRDLFKNRTEYSPKPGDLVFFDWEEDYRADHVGIVCIVDEATGKITTVEANRSKSVELYEYGPEYGYIMGYGVLPENPNPPAPTPTPLIPQSGTSAAPAPQAATPASPAPQATPQPTQQPARRATSSDNFTVVHGFADHKGGITYYVEAGPDTFPNDVMLTVSPINGNGLKDAIGQKADGRVLSVMALDFLFHDSAGQHLTPQKPVRMALYPATWDYTTEFILIAQVDGDGTVQILKRFDDVREVASGLRFEMEENAIYAIVFCVSES